VTCIMSASVFQGSADYSPKSPVAERGQLAGISLKPAQKAPNAKGVERVLKWYGGCGFGGPDGIRTISRHSRVTACLAAPIMFSSGVHRQRQAPRVWVGSVGLLAGAAKVHQAHDPAHRPGGEAPS
jgi:hypothetical protein